MKFNKEMSDTMKFDCYKGFLGTYCGDNEARDRALMENGIFFSVIIVLIIACCVGAWCYNRLLCCDKCYDC